MPHSPFCKLSYNSNAPCNFGKVELMFLCGLIVLFKKLSKIINITIYQSYCMISMILKYEGSIAKYPKKKWLRSSLFMIPMLQTGKRRQEMVSLHKYNSKWIIGSHLKWMQKVQRDKIWQEALAFFIALFGVSSELECNLKSTNHALAIE